ncbi:MAG: Hpt domain-containing protein [Actinomycetota bacterium]|nr:Hpt domain-containing protein [Actinomycetota bacterium]
MTPSTVDAALRRWATGERRGGHREADIRHRLVQVVGADPTTTIGPSSRASCDPSSCLAAPSSPTSRRPSALGAVALVAERAHKLKGSAANLGGGSLTQLLEEIELRSLEGSAGGPDDLLAVRLELDAFSLAVAAVLAEVEEVRDAAPAGT